MNNTLQLALAIAIIAATVVGLVLFFIRVEPALERIIGPHLGANWRTNFYGGISKIGFFITTACSSLLAAYSNPTVEPKWWFVIKMIPQTALPWIIGPAALIALASGILQIRATKDNPANLGPATVPK